MQARFSVDYDKLFKHLLELGSGGGGDGKEGGKGVTVDHMRSCFFGDYMDGSTGRMRDHVGGDWEAIQPVQW